MVLHNTPILNFKVFLQLIKCSVMRIAFGHSFIVGPVFKIAHFALPVVTQCTYLGVSYDTRLSFSTHISRVVRTDYK
jgi:hypothetical protein